jgi:geranylgeranyl diphosphate synthase type II
LDFTDTPSELYKPINYILSIGGKRIRPVLTLMACNLFSDDYSKVIKPAVALEVFHNFTLLHDDIMDNANTRRNHPTVHKIWNNNVAILSGDAMCIKAYSFVAQCEPSKLSEIFNIFNRTAIEVCEGQQYDMNFETQENVSIDEYIRMIKLKTAVLIAACLEIGALIGGASREESELLYHYGLNIGLAFQLQDDLLDVYADEVFLGKETGKDIISNKKTFLLIKAIEIASGKDLEELKKWILKKEFDPVEKIRSVRSIYDKLDIKTIVNAKLLEYFSKAEELFQQLKADDKRKTELRKFSDLIKERIF